MGFDIYIYIYSNPQIDCFFVSQLFSYTYIYIYIYIYIYMGGCVTVFNPVNPEYGTIQRRTIQIFKYRILNLSNPVPRK